MTDKDHLRIGVITGVHGLGGRLKVLIITDILERFEPNKNILLYKDNTFTVYHVTEFIPYKGKICLVRLSDVNDRETAQTLQGVELFIEKSEAEKTRFKLDENEFYYYEIIGCEVFYNKKQFGEVSDILEAGSGDILVITKIEGDKVMIPFVESMVDTGGISKKQINIYPPEGLLDL